MYFGNDPRPGDNKTKPIYVENDEYVINRNASRKHKNLLDYINYVDEPRFDNEEMGDSAINEAIALNTLSEVGMQDGGVVYSLPQYSDSVKKVTGALGGSLDENMYTEEGGYSRLNLASRLGVDPESMTVDTLSYEHPGSFVFDVKGVSPEGEELSGQESMSGQELPIEMLIQRTIGEHHSRAKGDDAEAYRLSNEREPLLNILKNIKSNVRFQNGVSFGVVIRIS